jgi:hypothetical protein
MLRIRFIRDSETTISRRAPVGVTPAGSPVLPSLGHERHVFACAELHDIGDLARIGRPHDAFCDAAVLLAPVDEVARGIALVREDIGVADDCRERLQEFRLHDP